MKTLRFRQDDVVDYFRDTYKDKADQVMAQAAVLELVRQHEVSVAKGAELLGMYVGDFVDLMAHRGVPYFTDEPRPTKDLLAQYRKFQPGGGA